MPRVACELVMVYLFRPADSGPEFLVLHRRPEDVASGTWQTIYGHIRPGETSWQTALREIREETGLRAGRPWAVAPAMDAVGRAWARERPPSAAGSKAITVRLISPAGRDRHRITNGPASVGGER